MLKDAKRGFAMVLLSLAHGGRRTPFAKSEESQVKLSESCHQTGREQRGRSMLPCCCHGVDIGSRL